MNKSLSLFVFAILSLAIFSSFASAAITFSNPVLASNTTFTITATSDNAASDNGTIIASNLTDSSNNHFSLASQTFSNSSTLTLNYTLPIGFTAFQSTGSLAYVTLQAGNNTAQTLYFSNQPQTVTACQLTKLTNSANSIANNLQVSVDSTSVLGGYGSSTNWYPLDNIEARVIVTNNGPDTIKNIIVRWILYDTTTKKKVMSGSEDSFSLKGNSNYDKSLNIDFKLDSPSNLNEGDSYSLYAWATGNDEAYDGNPSTCSSDNSDSININIDSHFVVLDSLTIPDSASCGGTAQITGTAWNIGSYDESNTYLIVSSTQLGINQRVDIGDINSGNSQDLSFQLNIPDDTPKGTYSLDVSVYNHDKTIFKNDNGDKSLSQLILNINTSCSTVPTASVSANLLDSSPAKAGQNLVVKATVINTGSTTSTFNLDLGGYSGWASLVSIDRNSVTLNAGESQDVLITLKANSDASGENTFNINLNQGTKSLSQPVSVTIQSGFSFPNLTGFFSNVVGTSGNNLYLWGIGALNVILVLIIIFVAARVVRKK